MSLLSSVDTSITSIRHLTKKSWPLPLVLLLPHGDEDDDVEDGDDDDDDGFINNCILSQDLDVISALVHCRYSC